MKKLEFLAIVKDSNLNSSTDGKILVKVKLKGCNYESVDIY